MSNGAYNVNKYINQTGILNIKNITIESFSKNKEDIKISIYITNSLTKENTTLNQIIKYLEPKYMLNIYSYNNSL